MKQISADEFEFLVFVQEELDRLEERSFGWPDEATMREVSTRLLHLTHKKEGSLCKLFKLFESELVLHQEEAMFLYTLYDESSPAAYAVNFLSELHQQELNRLFEGCTSLHSALPMKFYLFLGCRPLETLFEHLQVSTEMRFNAIEPVVIGLDFSV